MEICALKTKANELPLRMMLNDVPVYGTENGKVFFNVPICNLRYLSVESVQIF